MKRCVLVVAIALGVLGCPAVEDYLFPVWAPYYFDTPPAELGPYGWAETRTLIASGADGQAYGVTMFVPEDVEEPLPVFLWVMGSNVQAYYHQSLHESLASWGYWVIVPDTRPFSFTDFEYHNRIVQLADQTLNLALAGDLDYQVDTDRIAAGGYSVGAPLAAFTAALNPEIDALVYWAPSGSPYWTGLDPSDLYPLVTQPALYVLGQLDDSAPPEGGYPSELQSLMPNSDYEVAVIEGATHHQFQQPLGADQFSANAAISRFEQQGTAIELTRNWLDGLFGLGFPE